MKRLEKLLGVRFRHRSLLNQSLVHRSYLQTAKPGSVKGDNETLEFLGDAVLGLVISEELFRLYAVAEVGDLAKIKSQVVSRATLGEMALEMKLDEWILLGQGETARGEGRRSSVIGSVLEAVLGAIFIDRGMAPAARLIKRLFRQQIEAVETGQMATDYKSLLQEYVLRYFKASPEYRITGESGPGHRRRFHVSVAWRGRMYGQGTGPSKKSASQEAAKAAQLGDESVLLVVAPVDRAGRAEHRPVRALHVVVEGVALVHDLLEEGHPARGVLPDMVLAERVDRDHQQVFRDFAVELRECVRRLAQRSRAALVRAGICAETSRCDGCHPDPHPARHLDLGSRRP